MSDLCEVFPYHNVSNDVLLAELFAISNAVTGSENQDVDACIKEKLSELLQDTIIDNINNRNVTSDEFNDICKHN